MTSNDNKVTTRNTKEKQSSDDETKALLRELSAKIDKIDSQLKRALEENKKMKEEMRIKDEAIASLNSRIDLLEQRSRINNIEIGSFPLTPGEDLVAVVKAIGNKVGVEITDGDIQAVHRVPRYNSGTKNIVVQMCSRWKKKHTDQGVQRLPEDTQQQADCKRHSCEPARSNNIHFGTSVP